MDLNISLSFTVFLTLTMAVQQSHLHPTKETQNQWFEISMADSEIPMNSWFRNETSPNAGPSNHVIRYLRKIRNNTPITIYYTVSSKKWGLFRDTWTFMYDGSVGLCDMHKDPQDFRVASLIREVIGMPEGCPVSSGKKQLTSRFPGESIRSISIPSYFRVDDIRISTRMVHHDKRTQELLFLGDFYMTVKNIYPWYPIIL